MFNSRNLLLQERRKAWLKSLLKSQLRPNLTGKQLKEKLRELGFISSDAWQYNNTRIWVLYDYDNSKHEIYHGEMRSLYVLGIVEGSRLIIRPGKARTEKFYRASRNGKKNG